MKAAYFEQTGPPDVIRYGELPAPKPERSDVLIQTEAVSVNPIDTLVRSGSVAKALPRPYIVGADFAGHVVACGPETTRFEVGQRVWGCNWHEPPEQGTFAEYVCTDEKWVYPLPDEVACEQATALALVGITAHLGLIREAGLQRGEFVFVNGGSSGVGSAVIQMASTLEARVLTTAGDASKAETCRHFGADDVIIYKKQNLRAEIERRATKGIDVWFDVTREPDLQLAVNSLASQGRLVVISGRDAISPFPVGPFYVKCCRMSGFQLTLASPDDRRRAATDMNTWAASGRLKAHIGSVLPLSQAARSHQLQEEKTFGRNSGLAGKIVLKPDRSYSAS